MMCFGLKDRKRLKTNHCVIVLLDDTQLVHELHPSSTGQDLLDVVIKHLNLLETSYFGLKYYSQGSAARYNGSGQHAQYASATPSGQQNHRQQQQQQPVWLDMDRSAVKQLRDVSPMTVHFGVKYYATDPCKLAEEITRYQFFLQCKQDILTGRLPVSFELAIELFGLAIQSELGDYDPSRHLENYASEFQFVAHQTLELEQRAALYHRQLVGQVPATAELNFLEKVKWLDLYGCQLHLIQYDDGDPASDDLYALGLNPSGVLVLRNRLKVAQYFWSQIVKTKCQGRCFLMDVIEANSLDQQQQLNGGGLLTTANNIKRPSAGTTNAKRNRFGFRLADKEASRRLRWAIEEHKHFYHLIHSTATFNQLARHQRHQQQQQQAAAAAAAITNEHLKLSQRFRNSIRSAINLGAQSSFLQHQQQQAQLAFQQQQQRLRSSIKSLNHNMAASRQPPVVVRTPSRRYSNRSLPRLGNGPQQQQTYSNRLVAAAQANGNGLPPVIGMSHTLMPDQRQQAMLMMASQQQQQQFGLQLPAGVHLNHHHHRHLNKSHTLRPISSKEAKQRGYYQMLLAGSGQGGRPNLAEVSILPPGQHIVQPSIYRATSVVDGINQLADIKQQQQQQQFKPTIMQQFFNTRPQAGHRVAGQESPRSTKSAMAPSSALKLASKKLAKQQQQLLYGTQSSDVRPLLGHADQNSGRPMGGGHGDQLDLYYANAGAYYSMAGAYSASASPRSARSQALHRSKSTGENLHMAHKHQQQAAAIRANSKMLLATVTGAVPPMLSAHILPPPDYNSSSETPKPNQTHKNRHHQHNSSSKLLAPGDERKNLSNGGDHRRRNSHEDDDDYCSRSDCSSMEENMGSQVKARQARFINGRLVNVAAAPIKSDQSAKIRPSSDWLTSGHDQQQDPAPNSGQNTRSTDPNNNNVPASVPKNIANKQATPILLSMSQHFGLQDPMQASVDHTKANSKAVQLLNRQRQHLQASGQSPADAPNRAVTSASSGSDSAGSSVASSPQLPVGGSGTNSQPQQHQQHQTSLRQRSFSQRRDHHNAADSTGSSSTTTSGYYAGSNSTEPASVDSDTVSADCGPASEVGAHHSQSRAGYGGGERQPGAGANNQEESGGTRAKIALGVHGPGARRLASTQMQARKQHQEQQQFYLSDRNSSMDPDGHRTDETNAVGRQQQQSMRSLNRQQQQWAQLEQMQHSHGPASLKYVSFDV